MSTRPARFLVLRGGAIGDFILTLPALRALRARWLDAYIELVGYPHIARLALGGGLVDCVRSLDAARIARFFSRRPAFDEEQIAYVRSFDVVITWLHDPDGTVCNNLLNCGARQVLYGSPLVTAGHAADVLMKPLEELAIYPEGEPPRLAFDEADRAAARQWLQALPGEGPVLAVHPGSGSPAKNWPFERFAELAGRARAAGARPFFILGEADHLLAPQVARLAPPVAGQAPAPAVLTGRSLAEVGAVLSGCAAYVGNDSGITHVAAAAGVPAVALFGPSDAARWSPRGPRVRVLPAAAGDLTALGVDEVWSALADLLK